MKYLDYRGMKEYYTIDEVCRLFEISRQELKHYADKYGIQPQEDQYGDWGFRKARMQPARRATFCFSMYANFRSTLF